MYNPKFSEFKKLAQFFVESGRGISLSGEYLLPKKPLGKRNPPLLKHYFVGSEVRRVIRHNLAWAKGRKSSPEFKFAYLMLPTACNQKCIGCFTGKDKSILPKPLDGAMFSRKKIKELIDFLKEHGGEAIVYGGGGELFTYDKAFELIKQISDSGLGMIIFTNGTLLSKKDIKKLASMDVSLIISMRDTSEEEHNKAVGIKGFRKTLLALEYALEKGMHKKEQLAVEIPVTRANEKRVLNDFIPVMRSLGVVPFVEEFIQIRTSDNEKKIGHSFLEAREFFEKARKIDRKLGYNWENDSGQRIIAQPKCKRPLYSFAVYPSGAVMDCPSHSISYGNFYDKSLQEVIYSKKFKEALLDFELCACSVFYTKENEIPEKLPKHLEAFR